MDKVRSDINDLHDSSLDSSADGEYMNLIKEEQGLAVGKTHLAPRWSTTFEENTDNFKELSSSLTYKLISMPGEESTTNMDHSPAHDTTFYVISNPGQVFDMNTEAATKKIIRREPREKSLNQSRLANNTAKKRDDKRRATHNEVERRRRDKINNWITKLAALLPNSGMPDTASKGGILSKACDHITELTERQKRLETLESDNDNLILELRRLKQELSEVRKENSSMRNQLADNCIVYSRIKGEKS